MYNEKGQNINGESYIDSYGNKKSKIKSAYAFVKKYGTDCINNQAFLKTYGKEQMLQALLIVKNKK